MPTMPDVVGLTLADAQASLQTAGVLDLTSLGYFSTWPVTVDWRTSSSPFETVTAQSPASSSTVTENSSVTLTVAAASVGVVYP